MSFEAAIYKLGALIIGFSNIQNTALNGKGETLADTISVISKYVDAIIIRHPKEGAAKLASEFSNNKPIFNAGDGSNQHPTQTILDIFSIQETQHRLDNINIAIIGDLKYGRTVHSLVQAMIKFDRNVFYFISPDKLSMPACILNMLDQKNIKYSIHSDIKDIIKYLDIIYMTRIQKERLEKSEFDSINKKFKLNINSLKEARNNLKILHPLPKIDEISCEVDHTPYAYYFQQAENGLFARQALLAKVLSCE